MNSGVPRPVASGICDILAKARAGAIATLNQIEGLEENVCGRLRDLLVRVESVLPLIGGETATEHSLEAAAAAMESAGGLAEELQDLSNAYNFYESAWHIGGVFDRPALEVAEKLRLLSDPANVDQYHSAIWRVAIERFRRACDTVNEWSAALDAVELALTCKVPSAELQSDLFQRLLAQIRRAEGTPAEEIIAIVAAQAPDAPSSAITRRRARLALAGVEHEVTADTPEGAIELLALAQAQVMLDDLRLRLSPDPHVSAEILWTDLTLRDSRLASAVPAGRSLLVHLDRSAVLLLDLAHEIAHAITLQGPIGLRSAAYRTVTNYLEFLLIELAGNSPDPAVREVSALRVLPGGVTAKVLAERQLRAATLANIERMVWRSWLEGVSMYIELLCDPTEDPNEISSVHEAIRSLIDIDLQPNTKETEEAFKERLLAEIARPFEAFFSEALRKRSRPQHIAYFDDGHGREASDLYVLGYLVVRSVVAAWEQTLARRLPPIIASKLLLNATKAGLFELYAAPDEVDADLAKALQARYIKWLKGLAELSQSALEAFFAPVDPSEKGRIQIWQNGVPRTVEDVAAANQYYAQEFGRLHARMAAVMGLDADASRPSSQDEVLLAIFNRFVEDNRLLPIGSAKPRLLLPEGAPGRVGLNVRTYVSEYPDHQDPLVQSSRYYLRYWNLPRGADEADEVRSACAIADTDRLYTTRIIDLVGHPAAPFGATGFSYLVSFLARTAKFVKPTGGLADISESHREFAEALERRVFPPYGVADEEETIAKVSFLANRLLESDKANSSAEFAIDISGSNVALEVAMAAAGAAFMPGAEDEFSALYVEAMDDLAFRHALAASLFETGRRANGQITAELQKRRLTERLFSGAGFSGVTPYGERK